MAARCAVLLSCLQCLASTTLFTTAAGTVPPRYCSPDDVLGVHFSVPASARPRLPHGRSVTLERGGPDALLRLLSTAVTAHPADGLLRGGGDFGWPHDDAWYASPGPGRLGGAFLRKSQLPGEAAPPPYVRGGGAVGVVGLTPAGLCAWTPVAGGSTGGGEEETGTGDAGGGVGCVTVLEVHAPAGLGKGSITRSVCNSCGLPARVELWEASPWFVTPTPGTLLVWASNGSAHGPGASARHVVQAGVTRGRPSVHTWELTVGANECTYASYRYVASMLHAEEAPPNTHHGVQLIPVHVTAHVGGGAPTSWWLPPLLLELPSPDFSMPYNVITFVSTALAFTAGSVLNAIGRPKGKRGQDGGAGEVVVPG